MKIRKILVGIVFAAMLAFTACASGDTQMSEEDAALRQKLLGVWLYTDSAQYDENGDLTSFSAYEFTEWDVKRHDVTETQIMSGVIDEYTIEDGKFTVVENGKKVYAIIEIKEIDGKDHLLWNINSGGQEFVRMTDDEVFDYHIPAGEFIDGEAELLGIETTAAESGSSENASAETEAAAETSAASEE